MTVDSLQFHSYLEESCEIVDTVGYTLNRENNEILATFKQALACLVEAIDMLREPISNLSEVQEKKILSIKRMFAFIIYKVKVQDIKSENHHLSREEIKELKANLATNLCEEFDIKKQNTCKCLNDRERLAEHAVQLIALDKKSGRLFLLKNSQPIRINAELITVNLLNNLNPLDWRIDKIRLLHERSLSYQDNPSNPFVTLVSNRTKFSFGYSIDDNPKISPSITALWEISIKGKIPLRYTRFGASKENYFGRKQLHILEKDDELYFQSHIRETDSEFIEEIPPIISDEDLNNHSFTEDIPFFSREVFPFDSKKMPTNGCYFIHEEDLVAYLGNRYFRVMSAGSRELFNKGILE